MTLSLMLGWFGLDRCYLGYPMLGLLKFLTFGGFLIGNWIDLLLLSLQQLQPADGNAFQMELHGARVEQLRMPDWRSVQLYDQTEYSLAWPFHFFEDR
jgi:TM2 domain-containing membrane protein YozV